MTARLVGWVGDRRVEATLSDVVRLGAAADNEFSVDSSDVSAKHARVLRQDNAFWIEDLGSGGGTFINGERVERSRLHHLDVITLGREIDLVFIERDAPDEALTVRPGATLPPPVNVDAEWKTNLYAIEELRGGGLPTNLRPSGGPREETSYMRDGAIQVPSVFRKDAPAAPETRTGPSGRHAIPTNTKIAADGATLPPQTGLVFREVGPPPSVLGRSPVPLPEHHSEHPTPVPMPASAAGLGSARPGAAIGPLVGVRLSGPTGDFRLPLGRSSIGRAVDAVVRIESREVSRVHAYLVVTPTDVKVEDNGSSNGTSVNGHAISAPRMLVDGDRLAVRTFEFRVELLPMEGGA